MHKQRGIAARPFWPMLAAVSGVLGSGAPAFAQVEGDSFGTVRELPREGYEPRTIQVGNLVIRPELDVTGVYDSNIYAQESGKVDDVVVTATPRISYEIDKQSVQWNAEGYTTLRRYVDNSDENSTTFGVMSRLIARPTDQMRFGGAVKFVREAEDRGDPEGRTVVGTGPRLFNDLTGELFFGLQGSRLGVEVRGEAEKINYLSSLDDERDHSRYRGSIRGLYRLSALLNFFAQGYVSRREYRLSAAVTGVERDSTTYGGTVGVHIDPGGKLRGEAQVGMFRFEPDNSLLSNDTGLQFGAGLTYSFTPRTAFNLTAFRGDVATVRAGATGRTDTRMRLGVQQEVRHNFLIDAGVSWRETQFRGLSGQDQQKWGADLEAEYLLNRLISLAALGQYNSRDSDVPGEDFSRYQLGLALRLKY